MSISLSPESNDLLVQLMVQVVLRQRRAGEVVACRTSLLTGVFKVCHMEGEVQEVEAGEEVSAEGEGEGEGDITSPGLTSVLSAKHFSVN